jgi:hypothetical protein
VYYCKLNNIIDNIKIEVVYVDGVRDEDTNSNKNYYFSKTNPSYVTKHVAVTGLHIVAMVENFLAISLSFCETSNTLLSWL